MEHLYDRIKTARDRAGLTVRQAAETLGVSRVQVWRMGETVVEILRQETRGRICPPTNPLVSERYQGLDALLIKQASRS